MKRVIERFVKLSLIATFVIISTSHNFILENNLNNEDIYKTVDLSKMAMKANEFLYDDKFGAKDTFTGDLTGYVYNCPACTGQLYCNYKYDLSDGTYTYNDDTYGEVNIVASSKNLPCGTIIRFESKRISDSLVYAIVLDRGVLGTAIDFLSPDINYARMVGRSQITYDVIRTGWNK